MGCCKEGVGNVRHSNNVCELLFSRETHGFIAFSMLVLFVD